MGGVNDAWDPYVIDEYVIGWKAVDAEQMYYNCDGDTDCEYGGCDCTEINDEDTMVTVSAPGTAHREEILGYDDTESYACWVWWYPFYPNYENNPYIYVLNCYDDVDCSANQYCDKSSSWSNWDCVNDKSNGQSCTSDSQCSSGYCDNDGVGLADDNHCFTPYNTYFDNQETSYCEYSTGLGIVYCDERQSGGDLNFCSGTSYYEEECSSTCSYQDITSVFECTDAGCSCTESLCDGLTIGSNINTCSSGETYFADKCISTASGEDREDNICRNSIFAGDCTADLECGGVEAGTNGCSISCESNITNTAPIINTTYPDEFISIEEPQNQTFNITYTDTENDSAIMWYVDEVAQENYANSSNYTWIGNYTQEGSYNITVMISDSEYSDTYEWNLTVNNTDILAPTYSNITEMPDPAAYYPNQYYEFNVTWTDNEEVESVWIEFDDINYTSIYNISNVYTFNITNLAAGIHYYTWYANDTSGNLNYTEKLNYTVHLLEDTYRFYVKNESGANVTWLGNKGNVVLKGVCISQPECIAPENSFRVKNSASNTVAYIDSAGNMCIESEGCSYKSESCNPVNDAFIIKNESKSNMIYIDDTGDLCLTGYLIQNGIP